MKLDEWQKEMIIRPLFGWIDSETGLRRYRRCLVFIPRKNGKSTLGAAVALYLCAADGEAGAEIYSAAADREQARLIHSIAKGMIENNPELSSKFKLYQNSIVYPKNNSYYHVLSADVSNKHGKNAHGIIFDELHTQPSRDLWDVLTTSVGSRRQPVILSFTTAGYDRETICYEQYEYAKKVRDGILVDDQFLPVIYESDPQDDFSAPEVWAKCNPNLGGSLKREYIISEATRAVNEPSYENTFRRLQLNQWTTQDVKWISDEDWMKCNLSPVSLDQFKGMKCRAGLDLASVRDTCAFVLDFKDRNDVHTVIPFFFVPEMAIKERQSQSINYDVWVKQGMMIVTPGNVTDYDFIRKKINEIGKTVQIDSIEYDRYNASQLIINLQADGFTCNPFGQGFVSMSTPTKELEKLILSGQLNHGGNPVLRWQFSNIAIQEDAAGNIKIAKDKCKEKVDGCVAMVMAIGGHLTHKDETKSPYLTRGVRTL